MKMPICKARLCFALVALALTAACATPGQVADSIAQAHGLTRLVLAGDGFDHLAYSRGGAGNTLHVYLENDGTPWSSRYVVATDPTPRRPVMLELMALDSAPVLYLGRPCYSSGKRLPSCTPSVWTYERYSARVVDSLAAALRRYLQGTPFAHVALFGHSGGGTLAVLLAERVPETVAVVTLAGNLDLAGWTAYHRYTPLTGSLDPAVRAPLDPRILQWHYAGGRDGNVPASLIHRYASGRPGVRMVEIAEFDHVCCWSRAWPEILRELDLRTRTVFSAQ
jgi:hypothetical protein